MKITLVCGSHRKNSQSLKVTKFLSAIFEKKGIESNLIDLGNSPLPIWEPGMWEKDSEIKKFWKEYSKGILESDAYIFITPEYAGMASPALKNFFLYLSGGDISHKPGLIVTVSSGMGGSYPNAELRMSSYKNTRIVYIPDHVIVRHVETLLNADSPESKEDEYIRNRLTYVVNVLIEYAKAFTTIRSSGVIDIKTYPFGL
ncbi:NADPH-dependent oxidoreductase [Leptospira biflexa]|jgi:NAD(P)H-dependent FMN reductase|uniref:Putative reductase n=1 Tax=Leptospira biflexa serovar Patoc (strain Patoc 1 / ATCC 23582 / Paris) TaxID=456481 RepID=B0STN2_LEPBP|nr:NAD(P)H-dependent oxidoreductase [Leptospira biflexa]ABZ95852.1 Flavoprotein [Leptospira biflexa serovar Patoc strain 'Patoc 1 (Ames)']ABZ99566.1 Putative reductase [Leptospira biflexa serovar Patoc strain 'Patoc 1 (Paris)']TGM32040.1 NADPH-dependent oxidoreductase [Leptospira biflexa]TGM38991.1 NADPH-dependent oxidoreductase [Leptospira biflexa]TGM42788.1 NADPH-dependent oxidoreductase [Leptospira biflexa]